MDIVRVVMVAWNAGPKPPYSVPPRGKGGMGVAPPVKRELGVATKAVESDREAKIKAKMAAIRTASKNPDAAEYSAPIATRGDPAKEQADSQKFERMIPILEERLATLEDEAERVAITAAPLNMDSTPELRNLQMNAVRDTERVVKTAMANVANARKELEKRQREVASYAPIAQETASVELNKMQGKLEEIQQKLEDFATVRKDYEVGIVAEKLIAELGERLSSIEMDCDKAAMMAEPLDRTTDIDPQDINTMEIAEAKEAIIAAKSMLTPTLRLITGKVDSLKRVAKTKMLELQTRGEAAVQVLEKAQVFVEEADSRAAAGPILTGAQDYLVKVEKCLAKMRDTEAPFLMGIEVLPGEEGAELVMAMDDAANAAHATLEEAMAFAKDKLSEVAKFTPGASKTASAQLRQVQASLTTSMKKVQAFQKDVASKKSSSLVELVRARVEEAEGTLQRLQDAGAAVQKATSADLAEALEMGKLAETQAQTAIALARRELQEKMMAMKPAPGQKPDPKGAAEMQKAKNRVHTLDTELTKYRKLVKDTEEQINVEQSLSEISENLKAAEAEVDQLGGMSENWPTASKIPAEEADVIKGVQTKLSSAMSEVEKKLHGSQGLELKELRAIFNRLKASQQKLDKVKAKASQGAKAEAAELLKGVTECVQNAETKLKELSTGTSSANLTLTQLEDLQGTSATLMAYVGEAHKKMGELQSQGLAQEVKVEFSRLQVRVRGIDNRAKIAAGNFGSKFEEASSQTVEAFVTSLREISKRPDGTYDSDGLFAQIAGGDSEIHIDRCADYYLARQPELYEDKVRFAFRRIAPYGLSKSGLAGVIARVMKVKRELTITDDFAITVAKSKRRVEPGELLEVLTEEKEDLDLALKRAQCRALRDGTVGWVTLKSASGESFVDSVPKPYLWLPQGAALTVGPEASSGLVRELFAEEVVALIEGPRKDAIMSDKRVRGMACMEDTAGWLQVEDKSGKVIAKLSKVHKCTESVAMTDVADFETCNMLRRIEAGEALEQLPDKLVVPSEGGSRGKFRACRDGTEGWVTISGSQGTHYLKPAPRHYVCLEAAPLHAGLGAESEVVRVLMPGEAFAGYEEPKDVDGADGKTFYKVRTSKDGVEGWIAASKELKAEPWRHRYQVTRTVPLTKTLAANEAAETVEVVRMLDPEELVDAAEPPIEDRSSGQLRVRCSTLRDKVVGWATVRDASSRSALVTMTIAPEKAGGKAAGKGKSVQPIAAKKTFMAVKEESA